MNQFRNQILACRLPPANVVHPRGDAARFFRPRGFARPAPSGRAAGARPASACARAACRRRASPSPRHDDGVLVGTLRFWSIEAGDRPRGFAARPDRRRARRCARTASAERMIRHGLERARELGHEAVLLVGDAPYYERFGFSRARRGKARPAGAGRTRAFPRRWNCSPARSMAPGLVRATGASRRRKASDASRLDPQHP